MGNEHKHGVDDKAALAALPTEEGQPEIDEAPQGYLKIEPYNDKKQSKPEDYQPYKDGDFVLMPPIVQPVAMVTHVSVEDKKEYTPPPKTVAEVFEIIAPANNTVAVRVSGLLALLFSIIAALPFLLEMANQSISSLEEYLQCPNLFTAVESLGNKTFTENLPVYLMVGGLCVMMFDCILSMIALMSGTRMKYSYVGLFAFLLMFTAEVVTYGAAGLQDAIAESVECQTVIGVGAFHALTMILCTALSPNKKGSIKKKEDHALNTPQ